jgi:hypothetical protein
MPKSLQAALDYFAENHDVQQGESIDGLEAICPHCGSAAVFRQLASSSLVGDVQRLVQKRYRATDRLLIQAACPAKTCKGLVVVSSSYIDADDKRKLALQLLWPVAVRPSMSPAGLDPEAKQDYDEARATLAHSPSAAAALARRCLQYVIRSKMEITKRTLADEIAAATSTDLLSRSTRQALDHVRTIGNLAAHPELDIAGSLVRVSRDEAEYTLDILELLFTDLYFVPTKIASMSNRLNQ